MERKISFRGLGEQYAALREEIDSAILGTVGRQEFILGGTVLELERALADYVGRRHCVAVASGTDALVLSLKANGIGPGDAVFVPDFTYVATASSVCLVGATPVFVDIEPASFNLGPAALEETVARTAAEGRLRPKAVIPVDLFGLPADYAAIEKVCGRYGLLLIEDAAQGFGGSVRGRMAGSFGAASATSFFPAKPLGCYGDGGAVFTDDDEADARLRSLRASGRSPRDKYENVEVGYNSRLDAIQAAILLVKLRAFRSYELEAVNRVAGWYDGLLSDRLSVPSVPEGHVSARAQYTVRFDTEVERDLAISRLKRHGIPFGVYYPRGLHAQPAFRDAVGRGEAFPSSEAACRTALSLPIHPYLDREDVEYVVGMMSDD